MNDDPSYRFSCSQAQQYAWIEERHPELFERIVDEVGTAGSGFRSVACGSKPT